MRLHLLVLLRLMWRKLLDSLIVTSYFLIAGPVGRAGNPTSFMGLSNKEYTDPRRVTKTAAISATNSYSAPLNPYGRRHSTSKSDRDDRELNAVQSKTESMGLGSSRKVPAAQSVGH